MLGHVSGIHRAPSSSELSIKKARSHLKDPASDKVSKLPRGTIWEAELCALFLSSPRSLAAGGVNYPLRKQTSKPTSLPKVTPEGTERLGQPFSLLCWQREEDTNLNYIHATADSNCQIKSDI